MIKGCINPRSGAVSALALIAAGAFLPSGALACEATAQVSGSVVTSVDVVCDLPTPYVIDTDYQTFLESELDFDYDGAGDDTVSVLGGDVRIQQNPSIPFPAFVIETLDGDDTFTMTSGNVIGEDGPGGPPPIIQLNVGNGNDTVNISGGLFDGAIFLGDGNDTANISGGEMGPIFAGGGNDTVAVSGTAQIGILTPGSDSVGLEDGDDEFTMTGGTLDGGVSGNAGNDTISISGGLVAGYVAGNKDSDTIDISGTAIIGQHVTAGEGDDSVAISGGTVTLFLDGGTGNDSLEVSGGAIGSDIFAGDGDDTVEVTGGTIGGSIFGDDVGPAGIDTISLTGGSIAGAVFGGGGNDTVTVSGTAQIGVLSGSGSSTDSVGLEGGNDEFTMTGGTLDGGVSGNAGSDTISISGGLVAGYVAGNENNDTISISGTVTVGEHVTADEGDDIVSVSGGTVTLFVAAGTGNDSIDVSGGTIGSDVFAGAGDDTMNISAGAIGGSVSGEAGDDIMTIGGGTVDGDVLAGDGDDTMNISAGDIGGSVSGEAGDDIMTIAGGSVGSDLFAGDGDDTVNISAGAIGGDVSLEGGADIVTIDGGTIDGDLLAGDGGDTVNISAGNIGGSVAGGAGTDTVTIGGGSIGGNVEGETVRLFGGSIGGDITGISNNTLVVEAAGTSLNLRDGVLFQGTDAVGTITGTDLARAEGTSFDSQNFQGFSSLGVDGSTIGFSGPTQTIDELSLVDGSTLFVAGQVINLLSTDGGAGNVSISNSTINMINDDPTDRFNVGNATFDAATLAIDINQETIEADQLVASGLFQASGANVVLVNLLGAPVFSGVSIIPIAPVAGETVDPGGTGSALFTVQGITATPGSLFTYDVVTGSDGGIYLRALPSDLVSPQATRVAIDSRPIENVTDTITEISDDAIADIMELPKGSGRSDAGPGFGVYASGQLARVNHDGFTVSDGTVSAQGPSFSANDFSLAASLELDVAKYYGFDDRYGLNVGLFGGYASSDVTLDPVNGFQDVGDAENESGMIGAYGLFRRGTDYALVSATTFIGETEIDNHVLGSTGAYDTVGYALTGTVGHIFMLGETLRFDLRGGALWASFEGDEFEDSQGNSFGESKVSFGAIKFEPGIYGDFNLDNGMAISPYGRLELQQRIGYENTGSVEGLDFEFDDADFSAALSAGFNLKVTPTTTVSSEIRTKLSSDSETFAGKLGVKVKF